MTSLARTTLLLGSRPDAAARTDADMDVGALFSAHAPFLLQVVQRLTGAGPHVEDIVQEVFIIAHKKRRELAAHPEVRGWLYRAAVNRIHQHRRSFARFARMLSRHEADPVAAPTRHEGASDLERREHAARIRRCVLQLPFACREAFVLFDLEGLSTREVAALLGVPEGTVASRVSSARAKFRALWLALEDA